jgi:hypothetical protein
MSYRTYDYACRSCGWHDVQLHTKGEQPAEVVCEGCGAQAAYVFMAPNIMTVALPDGTKRFSDLKVQRFLKRAAAEAKADRNFAEEKRLKTELKKVVKE